MIALARKGRIYKNLALSRVRSRGIEEEIDLAYRHLLLRGVDAQGLDHYVGRLKSGEITRNEFLEVLRGSEEFRTKVRFKDLLTSLHWSRCQFVRSFPRARRILDLGGASQSYAYGSLIAMGYPYDFEKLVILDLPTEDRHELYQYGERPERVDSPQGPVEYVYRSMTDLSNFGDGEFDLIYSGQSIEHISEAEGELCLKESFRVLKPGGHLVLDTPNGRVCRIQQPDFINPDHQVEYTHEQLANKFEAAGFQILEAKGLNYVGRSVANAAFSREEAAANMGVYWQIEDCYLLAYVCQKPD